MERERLVELLGSVRGVREAVFRVEEALLEALSAERASDFLGDEHERGSDERFKLAELGDWLKIIRTTAHRLTRVGRIAAYRIGRATRVRRRDVERWLEVEGKSALSGGVPTSGTPRRSQGCANPQDRVPDLSTPRGGGSTWTNGRPR